MNHLDNNTLLDMVLLPNSVDSDIQPDMFLVRPNHMDSTYPQSWGMQYMSLILPVSMYPMHMHYMLLQLDKKHQQDIDHLLKMKTRPTSLDI